MDELSIGRVEAWLAEVDGDLARIDTDIKPLMEERTRLRERREILQILRNSLAPAPEVGAIETDQEVEATPPPRLNPSSVRDYVIGHATEILQEAGEPLHINELHRRFIDAGFKVPGAGKPVNLIVHLQKASKYGITQPRRGYYALKGQQAKREPQESRG